MKKLFTLLLALVATTSLWAHNFYVDRIYYNILDGKTNEVEVTFRGEWSGEYDEYSGSVTIPSTVTYSGKTFSVTSIGNEAFYNCSRLKSVTIPNSVTSIGSNAFRNCSGLTSVTIPNSVTSIGERAFVSCSGLTSVTIGNSVTSIGYEAFRYCYCLTSITIPNSVTSIGYWAFMDCTGLTSVTIGNSVTSIGNSTFSDCTGLTSVTIGNSVTSIGDDAFGRCSSLTSITIPNSVTSIAGGAFGGCTGLKSIVWNAEKCADFSFYDIRYQITSFTFGDSVQYIPGYLCHGMTALTSVTIPNSVSSIGSSTFKDCTALTSVTIGNSVTSIGYDAFSNTGIFNVDSNWKNGVLYISNCLIKVKPDQVATTYTIKDGTCVIADKAFYNCSRLTSVTIPNSVASIGEEAFEYCSRLASVTIGNSVTSIGNRAFENCKSLTSITIPNSVTSIGYWAFSNCTGLTSIESLAKTPPTLRSNAFYNVSTSIPVYVPCGSVSAYQSAEGWKAFTNIQCGSNEPSTDLENTHSPSPMANRQKVMRDGQLIILRDGKTYNAMGQEL